MSYYTERHGLRTPLERTETITYEMYSVIYDCCERYFDNIAWKFPERCTEHKCCCGLDKTKLGNAMKFEIPALYRSENGWVNKPLKGGYSRISNRGYTQYGLLDFIEFMYQNIKDITSSAWHQYHDHSDIFFGATRESANTFRDEINTIFAKTGLQYILAESGVVERVPENAVLSKEIETIVTHAPEIGLKDLLKDAIILYKTPAPQARRDSVEKIWDALERLKTYYTTMDKRASVTKIVNDIANNQAEFSAIFDEEFRALTKIGNDFRIRHHETNKIDITDSRHYDYFFNRCLSLIALAIQYLT